MLNKKLPLIFVASHVLCFLLLSNAIAVTLEGRWIKKEEDSVSCECGNCLDVVLKRPIDLCVESNQIYVKAYFKKINDKTLYLYFVEPLDVGRGGAALPWDDFDTSYPMAELSFKDKSAVTLKVKWNGFRNKRNLSIIQDLGSSYNGIYCKVNPTKVQRHKSKLLDPDPRRNLR